MPQFVPLEEMQAAHAAYIECTQELSDTLNEARQAGGRPQEWIDRIKALNEQCEQCLQKYLDAFEAYYGVTTKGAQTAKELQ